VDAHLSYVRLTDGDMVVIPPRTWHSFRPAGNQWLRHVVVYDSGHIDIELSSGRRIAAF
jgi:mannose-6-phosphate isomerase-like protein (cupin superfamily)